MNTILGLFSDKFDRSSILISEELTFTNNLGQSVQLQQFASIYQGNGPTKLQRRIK